MKHLSAKDLADGRLAALKNARDLVRDAEILLKNKRWARTVFLTMIAVEELGKYLMIVSALVNVLGGKVEWGKFWKRFRNHEEKLGNVVMFNAGLADSVEQTIALIEKSTDHTKLLQSKKLNALYTDYRSSRFIVPMHVVKAQQARKALKDARSVLMYFESIEAGIFARRNFTKSMSDAWLKLKMEEQVRRENL